MKKKTTQSAAQMTSSLAKRGKGNMAKGIANTKKQGIFIGLNLAKKRSTQKKAAE